MNKSMFGVVIASLLLITGCSSTQDLVTHQPGWQVQDSQDEENQKKDDQSPVILQQIF